MAETKKRIASFTTVAEVEVDVDPEDLHEAGWHHEDECSDGGIDEDFELPDLDNDEVRALCAAVASLHRQAHPGQSRSVRLCHEEPCRSLSLDTLREIGAAE